MRGAAQPGGGSAADGEAQTSVQRPNRDYLLPEIIMQCCNVCVYVLQDMRMLSSGKPAQHTAEMEADLEKAEGMIRLLFNDVQLLKDGRHLQAEQMYRRCKRNKHIKVCNISNYFRAKNNDCCYCQLM